MSRLSPERLKKITKLERPSAQARWFNRYFNVDIDYDKQGPIITETSFEGLVAKKLGLHSSRQDVRPTVKLGKRKAA